MDVIYHITIYISKVIKHSHSSAEWQPTASVIAVNFHSHKQFLNEDHRGEIINQPKKNQKKKSQNIIKIKKTNIEQGQAEKPSICRSAAVAFPRRQKSKP